VGEEVLVLRVRRLEIEQFIGALPSMFDWPARMKTFTGGSAP